MHLLCPSMTKFERIPFEKFKKQRSRIRADDIWALPSAVGKEGGCRGGML